MRTNGGKVAFWLRPAARERQFFASLIEELALRFDAPVFEPHVTLQGGEMAVERARDVLRDLPALPILQLEVERIAFSEMYTKTVFVQFRASAEANGLSAILAAALKSSADYQFDPHLSLIYKDMLLPEKEELARAIEIPFKYVTFDTLKAIACPAEIRQREDVEAWRTLDERALADVPT